MIKNRFIKRFENFDLKELLISKLSKIFWLLNSLLLLLIIVFSYFILDFFTKSSQEKLSFNTANSVSQNTSDYSIENYADLVIENPFKIKDNFSLIMIEEQAEVVQAQENKEVKKEEPKINFLLVGTIVGDNYKYAVIKEESGQQRIFKIGDFISGAGQIVSVDRKNIIIKTESGERTIEHTGVVLKEKEHFIPLPLRQSQNPQNLKEQNSSEFIETLKKNEAIGPNNTQMEYSKNLEKDNKNKFFRFRH